MFVASSPLVRGQRPGVAFVSHGVPWKVLHWLCTASSRTQSNCSTDKVQRQTDQPHGAVRNGSTKFHFTYDLARARSFSGNGLDKPPAVSKNATYSAAEAAPENPGRLSASSLSKINAFQPPCPNPHSQSPIPNAPLPHDPKSPNLQARPKRTLNSDAS